MLISVHKQATTTTQIRAAIQTSDEPAWIVAERYGLSEQTVWKWRKGDSVGIRSHTAHRLQTTLTTSSHRLPLHHTYSNHDLQTQPGGTDGTDRV